jgi:hypothetical protein
VAITNRTNVPAAIALDTAVEGVKPLLEFAQQIHLRTNRILATHNTLGRLTCNQCIRKGLPALMLLGQLGWTSEAHRDNMIRIQHADAKKQPKSALVAASY